ncbi:MAG TPA: PEP-CTERM sorting domain-containing protein [Phycisphaerae bacterium]|nr:PEP-CTERM sorting domain-containing protein [Phycisphaerae bacterium]
MKRAKRSWLLASAACVAAVTSTAPTAFSSYYVSDYETIYSQAGVDDSANGTTQQTRNLFSDTGQLQQLSLTNAMDTNAAGTVYQYPGPAVAQTTEGHIESTAEIGKLHSTVTSIATSNMVSSGVMGVATMSATDEARWSDAVHFHTTNPTGSNYTLTLTLDDTIDVAGQYALYENGINEADVHAVIVFDHDLSKNVSQDVLNQSLSVLDYHRYVEENDVTEDDRPPQRTVSMTVHVNDGAILVIDAYLETLADAEGGNTQVLVNAGNTANFNITTDDPLASYSTDSGTIFTPEATPEPASLGLLGAGIAMLALRRRTARR